MKGRDAGRVLVVDDDHAVRELLRTALRLHGFRAVEVASGGDALNAVRAQRPDLMLLDVVLPDLNGFEVCRRLRADGIEVPIIFVTGRDTTEDTVRGLALGGDDYVTKPFAVEALVERVRAVLRRARSPVAAPDHGPLRVADLELDETTWTAARAGTPLHLSPTEFRLLACLVRHQGRVLSRAFLLKDVWGWERHGNPQVVETYVSYLRRKLDPLGPPLIHTRRGVGYVLRP